MSVSPHAYPDENTTGARSRTLAAVGAIALAGVLTAALAASPAHAAPEETAAQNTALQKCGTVEFDSTVHPENSTFTLIVSITNTCDTTMDGWEVGFSLPSGGDVYTAWMANLALTDTPSGLHLVARSVSANRLVGPGSTVSFGLTGTYDGEYQPPTGCTINGEPCDPRVDEEPSGPSPGPPPQVSLTSPEDGALIQYPCPVTLAAEASSPSGEVTHVDFFLNGDRVASDETAPYETRVWPDVAWGSDDAHTAFARAYDDADPPKHRDSEPVQFQVAPPPPALMIVACDPEITITEGSSEMIHFQTTAQEDEVDLVVDGTNRIAAEPSSFVLDGEGQDVTVGAAEGTAGTTATIQAVAEGLMPATVSVEVVPDVSPDVVD